MIAASRYGNVNCSASLFCTKRLLLVGGHDKKLRFEENSIKINVTQVVIVLMAYIDNHYRNGN